jgi:hypothetical protein
MKKMDFFSARKGILYIYLRLAVLITIIVLISGSWDWPGLQSALVYEKGNTLMSLYYFFLNEHLFEGEQKGVA